MVTHEGKQQPRSRMNEQKLKRRTPFAAQDLEQIRRRLNLSSRTAALEEALTVLLLITEGERRSFLLEDSDGSIIRINL